jgi:hypothetical protein
VPITTPKPDKSLIVYVSDLLAIFISDISVLKDGDAIMTVEIGSGFDLVDRRTQLPALDS